MTGEVVVVAEASDPVEAGIWLDALHNAGIEAKSYERGVGAALGGAVTPFAHYPVLVPREAIAAARNVIADLAGGAALAPISDGNAAADRQKRALLGVVGLVAVCVLVAAAARLVGG